MWNLFSLTFWRSNSSLNSITMIQINAHLDKYENRLIFFLQIYKLCICYISDVKSLCRSIGCRSVENGVLQSCMHMMHMILSHAFLFSLLYVNIEYFKPMSTCIVISNKTIIHLYSMNLNIIPLENENLHR